MDIDVKAERLTDYAIGIAITNNPIIFDEISEDGWNGGQYIPDLVKEIWIYIATDGKIIGCYRLENVNSICGSVHAFILPEYRDQYSMAASQAMLSWYFDNIKPLEKIICYVPVKYQNVIHHAIKNGMKKHGTITGMHKKNGKVYDVDILGIEREAFYG